MIYRFILITFIGTLLPSSQGIAGDSADFVRKVHGNGKKAIIIQSQQIEAYGEAIKGIKEGCNGKDISIDALYDLKGYLEEGKKLIKGIKNDEVEPDLIFAVGILAAVLAKEQFPSIPLIFCMVVNHERFNLQGNNVTGISSEASMADQLAVLKELTGTGKNIGVIYDPMMSGTIVSGADHVTKKHEFNLVKKEVASGREVRDALNTIIDKIDALWLIPDSTVITKDSLDIIFQITQKHRIPTVCTSSAIVKAGALISISPDYRHTGLQAARLAQELLNGSEIHSLGMREPEKLKITINTKIADLIGVNLSSIRSRADVVLYP